jgi:hypothetical protein
MADIAASIEINAPVGAVFDFVVAEWQGTLDFWPRGILKWTPKSVSGPPVEGRWQFTAAGAGTRFSYRLMYRMPPPGLGPLLDRWFLAPAWRRAISAALANLKQLVERQHR